ncbi:MAG: Cna B-type domain-containing protein [Anaerovoracaceae bacterium]
MRKKINTFFAFLLAGMMVFTCGAVVYAGTSAGSGTDGSVAQYKTSGGSTDISDPAVDSITIGGDNVNSDGSVNPYTPFKVTVNFSEDNADGTQKSGLDIEAGDKIYVTWEAPEGVTFTGYTDTIQLYQDGDSSNTQLGVAEVTETGVTITFNDNVNNLQHVKGSVTFTLRNYGNPDSGQDSTGTITSGAVTKTVTVKYIEGAEPDFGAKEGYYDTGGENKIYWSIWINNPAQTNLTGNIVITDKLPDTETFDASSSFISYTYTDGNTWKGTDSLTNFNTGGRSIVYDKDTNTITITIPADELNGLTGLVKFYTTSTAEANAKVSNTISMSHYENENSTPIADNYTANVTVPDSSGTISGVPKGTIQINKVVNGTTDPIEGITFRVYKVNSSSDHTRVSGWYNGADYAEITTDKDGIASIAGLTDGVYELVEVTDDLPNWIATSDIESVYVELSGTAGTQKTIPNSVKTDTITAEKNWTESDGTTPETSNADRTVYFQLYRDGTALADTDLPDNQTAVQAVVTEAGESSAEVSWTDLPLYDNSGNQYTYSVKEVDASGNDYTPSGYTKSENGLTVTNSRETETTTSDNIDVTATKNWTGSDGTTADTSDHPAVYFKLYRSVSGGEASAVDGAEIKEVETTSGSSTAKVTWDNLPQYNSAGQRYTYSVKEVDASGNDYVPSGYTKTENGLTVTNSRETTSSDNIDVTATKNWTGSDGTTADTSDEDRTVYFRLYRNGTALTDSDLTDDQTAIKAVVTKAGESSAEVTWTDLSQYNSQGNEYTYTVREVDASGNDYVPSGYTKSENGLTVTNSRKTETTTPDNIDVTATKNWTKSDGTTADTSDHPSVYFKLYRSVVGGETAAVDGAEIKEVVTDSGASTATVTWDNLPQYDSAGREYIYSVKEVDADGTDSVPSGYTKIENGLTVTNIAESDVPVTQDSQNTTNGSSDSGSGSSSNLLTSIENAVQTGDTSNIAFWLMCLVISSAAAAALLYRKHKRNNR